MKQNGIFDLVEKYLMENKERFSKQEKLAFLQNFNEFLTDPNKTTVTDEVYDFLVSVGVGGQRREDEFYNYLNEKHGVIKYKNIMDVGAGRLCKLSQIYARFGNLMYAIDPKIRLTQDEADRMGIKVKKSRFVCDKYAKNGKGTPVKSMDYIFALEPCDATEHIVRQGLKYDVPFDISLCATPHNSLSGKEFETMEEWYEYLLSISKELEITKKNDSYYLSNDNYENYFERY